MSFALFATLVLAASTAIAAPQFRPPPAGMGSPLTGKRTCTVKQALTVPANQTVLTNPTTSASFVMLGVGVQNYTCSAAGTYALVLLFYH